MKYPIVSLCLSVAVALSSGMTLTADDSRDRVLFAFDKPDAFRQWQSVSDGVMGGRSDGRFRIIDSKTMEFYGNLSLANNGGFASVRSRGAKLGLTRGDSLVMRVKGDGRECSLNLYTPRRLTAFSYRASFQTEKSEWIEVNVPLQKFKATSFGRIVRNQPLDSGQVNGIGILLGDKKPGSIKLEVDWIKVRSPSPQPPNPIRTDELDFETPLDCCRKFCPAGV